MKKILIMIALLICSPVFAKQKFNIGVLYWSMNIEGQVIMRHGLEEETKEINKAAKKSGDPFIKLITFVAGDGSRGVDNQINQFYRLIKKKVDLIIVQPTDNAALTAPLKLANKKNIPVIAYDQYIVGGQLTSFITSNNYQAGYLDGEYISSRFKEDRTLNLILVEYPSVSSTIERVDGFFNALKKNKQRYKILKTYTAVEPIGGKKVGLQILKDFPKKNSIDVIFTINDGGGLAIVETLTKSGRIEIVTASVDGDPLSIKNIKNNKMTVIDSAQFCAEIGRQSVKTAYDKLQGAKVAKKILIPTFPITQETLNIYTGWKGKIPKSFKKKWAPFNKWDNHIKRIMEN